MDIEALERDLHDKVYRIDVHRLMYRYFKRDFCALRALAPLRQLAAWASGSCMQRSELAALQGKVRHLCRAHAACIAAPHAPCRCKLSRRAAAAKTTATVRPVLALQPKAASAGGARDHCFAHPRPQGSRKGTRRPRLQPLRGFRALRAAQHSRPLLRLPKGGTPQGTLSAQQSADRSTRPSGQVAPASCWAASSFDSPVGQRNEPSLRFGLLAFAPSAPEGHKVCSRLRPLHGLFRCFRPGRGEHSHALEPVKGTPRYARWLRHP